MAWRVARSLNVLLGQLNALAPHRSRASDGGIGDAAHAARRSDHNPVVRFPGDPRGIVTARDFTHHPEGGLDCQRLADALERFRDMRIKYIIFDRRIMSGPEGPSPWKWRPYRGRNPHTRHLHLSVRADPISDDTSPWRLDGVAMGAATVPTEFQPEIESSLAWLPDEDEELDLLMETLDEEGIGSFLGKVVGGAASGAATGAPAGPWGALIGAGVGAGMSALGAVQSPKTPRQPRQRPGTRQRRSAPPVPDALAAQIAQILPMLTRMAGGRATPQGESYEESWDYDGYVDYDEYEEEYDEYDNDDLEVAEEPEAVRDHRGERPRDHRDPVRRPQHRVPVRRPRHRIPVARPYRRVPVGRRWTPTGWHQVYRRVYVPRGTTFPGWRWTPAGWRPVPRVPLSSGGPVPLPPRHMPPAPDGATDQFSQLISLLSQLVQRQTTEQPPPEEPAVAEPVGVEPTPEPSPAQDEDEDDMNYDESDYEDHYEDEDEDEEMPDDEAEGC